jgi:membrane protein DedA with SNARE-associated domain
MISEAISNVAVRCLDAGGYPAAAGLMALESMIAPVPSEAVMPFVGFLVADQKWSLWAAILATSIGSMIGSGCSYLLGYYGGRPLVLRVGKYLLLNVHDLERAREFFHRRAGALTILLSRFIPVVRHFISIPAGTGRMPVMPFFAATLLGATLWNSFLLICGMKLREHWTLVQHYSHQIDIVVLVALAAGAVWFVRQRLKTARADKL